MFWIAMTGLLVVVVNVVVADALFQVVQDSVPGPRAELRPVLSAKNIEVGDSTIENYEAFAIFEVLAKGIIGNDGCRPFWSIFIQREIYRDGGTWKDHADRIQTFMWMARTKIEAKVVAFIQYGGNYISLNDSGGSFPSVRHLSRYRNKRSIQWVTHRTWNANPSALINFHRVNLSLPLMVSNPAIPRSCCDRSNFEPKFDVASFSFNILPERMQVFAKPLKRVMFFFLAIIFWVLGLVYIHGQVPRARNAPTASISGIVGLFFLFMGFKCMVWCIT